MFCQNCGAALDPNAAACPNCGAPVNGYTAPAATEPEPASAQQPFLLPKKFDKFGRSYAAIASALMVFPTLICLVFDYIGKVKPGMDWSFYVLGLIMFTWMACVLPALRPKRPALTACICAGILMLYLIFLSYISGKNEIFMQYFLPIGIMIIVSSVILMLLISYKVIKGEHILSAVVGEVGLLSIGFEILFDVRKHGAVELRWSLVMAVLAISGIAILEALSYIRRINQK